MSIVLTEEEIQIFDLLQSIAEKHNVIIRVAGGWVRDKILQTQNHDIDIAVENMTGAQFANIVHSEIQEVQSTDTNNVGRVTVIQANPEQSKFLETATMNVLGRQIDFAGLRQEIYQSDSRIPQVTPATACQDAERRDFTVNAMFFNLKTRQIEDFVGGIQDLEKRILRTPLEPMKTFYDDPLRMIRCVRFSCKLGFEIENNVYAALQNQESISRLGTVVAKSRFAPEVLAAIEHDPIKAVHLFASSVQLLQVVFYDDLNKSIANIDLRDQYQATFNDPNFINNFIMQAQIIFSEFGDIKQIYDKEQRGYIGFYVIGETFDKILNTNHQLITFNSKNIAFYANQKQKQYTLTMTEAISFLNCLQSMKFTVNVKQLTDVFYILQQARQMSTIQQTTQKYDISIPVEHLFTDEVKTILNNGIKTAKTQVYPLQLTQQNEEFNLFLQQIVFALNQLELNPLIIDIVSNLECYKDVINYIKSYYKCGINVLKLKFNVNVADIAEKAGLADMGRTIYGLVKKAVVWHLLADPQIGMIENIMGDEIARTFYQLQYLITLQNDK